MATINGKKDGNGNTYNVTTVANDPNTSDRHPGNSATTGQNIADKVYNIYDLEGNGTEYVAEKNTVNTGNPYVFRGGVNGGGIILPASWRLFYSGDALSGDALSGLAFHLSLYVM